MDFIDQIGQLRDRIERLKESIQTEEATKTAMVMPFLAALGYDVFDPHEVVPEFTCDVGIKKGEKIDYAVCRDDKPEMLIECKPWQSNLDKHSGQLFRYFHVSRARYGILTNGIEYRFYTDTENSNVMDESPFFIYRIDSATSAQTEELKQFHKTYFDGDALSLWAGPLKRTNAIKDVLLQEITDPSEAFVRLVLKRISDAQATSKAIDAATPLVKRCYQQIINDLISSRLTRAMDHENITESETADTADTAEDTAETENSNEPRIVTTQEELEGYYIVRSVLRAHVAPSRIKHRDTISYFGVLLDDNNRKPICRLYLDRKKKYIGTFDENKKETRHEIASIDDLYGYEEDFVKSIKCYDESSDSKHSIEDQ